MRQNNIRALIVVGLIALALVVPCELAAQSDGAGVFKAKCILCHGPNADGNTAAGKALNAKNLRSAEVQSKSGPELIAVVTHGQNKMPAFGQVLKPEQIEQVINYVRGLAKQ